MSLVSDRSLGLVRWCSMCVVLLVAPLAAMAQAPAAQKGAAMVQIPQVAGLQIGQAVADWQGQGLVVRALAGNGAVLRKSAEFEAMGRLGWDENGLLLQVQVTDATPAEAPDLEHLYEGDSVELCLMTAGKSEGMVQLIAAPGRVSDHAQMRMRLFDYRTSQFRQNAPAFEPRGAVKVTSGGYVMDLMLPWASLRIVPQMGQSIGVRFSINDSDGRRDGQRQSAIWLNGQAEAAWMQLAPVMLADKPAAAQKAVAWAGYEELSSTYVNVVAEADLAGKTAYVLDDGKAIGHGQLEADGQRAVLSLRMPVPSIGQSHGQLTVQLDGATISTIPMPDLRQRRIETFLSGGNAGMQFRRAARWTQPQFASTVFSGEQLPACAYPEPQRIQSLVGDYKMEVGYYDAQYNRVTRATKPGRYGAVVTVIAPDGQSFTRYETLVRIADGAEPASRPAALVAAQMEDQQAQDLEAQRADRNWWHGLRKALQTETRYEYFVRLPKGYDQDSQKRWPVIFYLHGSGGGDNPQHVVDNGPQIAAKTKPDFQFIVVSLRSPGGWYPPAVRDVIDAVEATYRTDPTRYYLTGFSMGGMGTWACVFDQPQRFAAIAPVGGRNAFLDRAAVIKDVPAWVINGSEDTATTAAEALKMVDALKAVGAPVKWTEIAGADHVESHVIAYGWDELYAWFLQQHR